LCAAAKCAAAKVQPSLGVCPMLARPERRRQKKARSAARILLDRKIRSAYLTGTLALVFDEC